MYRLYKPCINSPFWDCAMYFDDGVIQWPLKQPFSRPRSCHACHGPCTECCWQCCNGCRIRPNSRSAGVLWGCLPKQKKNSSSKHHTRKSGFSPKKNVDCMFLMMIWWQMSALTFDLVPSTASLLPFMSYARPATILKDGWHWRSPMVTQHLGDLGEVGRGAGGSQNLCNLSNLYLAKATKSWLSL